MERREPALVSLEVFILNQLSSIAQETSGRAQAQRDVRDAALKLLGEHCRHRRLASVRHAVAGRLVLRPNLAAHVCDASRFQLGLFLHSRLTSCTLRAEELGVADFGKPGSRLSLPFPPKISTQVGDVWWQLAVCIPCVPDFSFKVPAACCYHLRSLTASMPCLLPTCQLLAVLRGALALGNPRLAEPALSCMHKLVAYAYMQGETGPSGRLDDEANLVTQVRQWTGGWQHIVWAGAGHVTCQRLPKVAAGRCASVGSPSVAPLVTGSGADVQVR